MESVRTPASTDAKRVRNCDVVMKGGITSGVVYPRAVTELAKHFRLKSIGGTSAGAIAAAAAAAAEFSAQRGGERGFRALEGLPDFLGKQNLSGFTNLFTFFQPQPETKRIFKTLIGALEATSTTAAALTVLRRAVICFPLAALVGVASGAILLVLAWTHPAGLLTYWSFAVGIILAIIGPAVAVLITLIRRFGAAVPRNFFGLCSGMSTVASEDGVKGASVGGQALTVWLTKYLNEIAGLDPDGDPLTFGQLWQPNVPVGTKPTSDDPAIRLEMFTTCLSKGRPFRLPFRDSANVHENVCYFRREDLQRLFPTTVVKWLMDHPRENGVQPDIDAKGFFAMPDPWNLPVVVATRMSLSFPILLSAIPLFAYDYELTASADPHQVNTENVQSQNPAESKLPLRCWFSDGGICSNFPVHFFDAPVPGWPTFGINLVEAPDGTKKTDLAKPWMPKNNSQGIQDSWTHFGEDGGISSVVAFLATIIGTMQNWSDNTLSRMPGFRDRIAHVRLTKEEGGLNLQMPAERICELSERGVSAAAEFVRRFATLNEPIMNWPNHRWLRLRSMLASLVEMVEAVDYTCANPQAGDEGYEDWIRNIQVDRAPSYQWSSDKQRDLAIETIVRLRELAASWSNKKIDAATGAPRPRPELRPRPRT